MATIGSRGGGGVRVGSNRSGRASGSGNSLGLWLISLMVSLIGEADGRQWRWPLSEAAAANWPLLKQRSRGGVGIGSSRNKRAWEPFHLHNLTLTMTASMLPSAPFGVLVGNRWQHAIDACACASFFGVYKNYSWRVGESLMGTSDFSYSAF